MVSMSRSLGMCVVMSFLWSVATSQAISSPKTNPVDVQVLHELMYAVNYETDWRSQVPDPCVSGPQGIVCEADAETGVLFVTELQFGYISPLANIIPCVWNASIPESIGNFTRLRSLSFRRCFTNQSATLPDALFDLGPSLQALSFRGNSALTGALSARVVSLSGLQRLILSESSLRGAIPGSIAELSSLEQLDLSHNAFSGPVPDMAMESLVNLDLRYNALEAFPVLNAPRLQRLALSHNRLRGALLPDAFAGTKVLMFLDLSFNELSGALSATSLSGLARLEDLFLNGNLFESAIPEGLSELQSLVRLDLSSSGFVGAIPGAFERLEQLRFLSVSNNRLSGAIPGGLATLPVLFTLDLHANALSGPVPFAAPFVQRMGRNLLLRENAGLCYGPQLVATVKVLLADLKQCPESSILTAPPPPTRNVDSGSSRVPNAAPALHPLPASSIARIIIAASMLCWFLSRT